MSNPNIPAAWRPDPAGSEAKRWRDGTTWSEHLRVPEPLPAEPAAPTRQPYVPMARVSYSLPARRAAFIVYTAAVWWLAFSPAWLLLIDSVFVIVSGLDRNPD